MRTQHSATASTARTSRRMGPTTRRCWQERLFCDMDRIRSDWGTTTIEFVSEAALIQHWREATGADATRQPVGVLLAHAWRRDELNTRILLSRDVLFDGDELHLMRLHHALLLVNGFANLSPLSGPHQSGPHWTAMTLEDGPGVALVRHETYLRTAERDMRRIPPAVTFWPEQPVEAQASA